VAEELVERACPDEQPVRHALAKLGGRRAEAHLDARMVEQRLEERAVSRRRQLLEGVGEVPVVRVRPDRDPRADRGVELGRVEAPLLARVAAEEELVQLAAHGRDEDPEPGLRREPLGEHGAREPGPDDEDVDGRGRAQARASRSRGGHASVIGRGSPRLNRRPGV
jgi:hypothetical protein